MSISSLIIEDLELITFSWKFGESSFLNEMPCSQLLLYDYLCKIAKISYESCSRVSCTVNTLRMHIHFLFSLLLGLNLRLLVLSFLSVYNLARVLWINYSKIFVGVLMLLKTILLGSNSLNLKISNNHFNEHKIDKHTYI